MLQIHVESLHNPKVYRKLHLTKDQTLFDVEFILETIFDLDEVDAEYQVKRTGGKATSKVLYSMPDDKMLEDSSDDLLSEWLTQPGDELLVIDSEFEVRIVLEQLLDEGEGLNVCIAGEGHLHSNSKKKVNLDELNMELGIMQMMDATDFGDLENIIEPDYGMLLELSNELNKLKPWTYFANEDIIAIELAETEEVFYVAVMGEAEQEYGLMVYDEEFGYPSLANILSGKPLPLDFQYDMSGMTVNFVDRADLEEEDYELIKNYGFSFRGKNKWIQFRKYCPGTFPTIPNFVDVEVLKLIVHTMIEVTQLYKEGWRYPAVGLHQYPTFKVTQEGELSDIYIIEVETRQKGQIVIEMNDLEHAQFKRKQKVALQLEFDMFYLPQLVPAPDDETSLIYPVLYVALDRATGENIFIELVPFPRIPAIQQQMFWEMLKSLPIRPSKIFVRKEVNELLAPLAKKIGIELVVSELPIMQDFREYMDNMPPDLEEF